MPDRQADPVSVFGSAVSQRIVPFQSSDWPSVWQILKPVFREGESYPYAPGISEEDAYQKWVEVPTATYVVKDDTANILGTYYLKPNQPTLGAHVCNCGYVVSQPARGKGLASQMCQHSQQAARQLGFRAMQFNLVVSTNEAAVYLWKKLGFSLVGTLPDAFNHSKLGFVDAFVMHKRL